MIRRFLAITAGALLCTSTAFAATTKAETCSKIVSIGSLRYVLYKPSNLHGGRGPTFLVQNPSERTGKRKLLIKDKNCKTISSFGLYATDQPYGARYYTGVPGGKYHNAQKLRSLAKGGYILVEGKNDKWVKVANPLNRQGTIK